MNTMEENIFSFKESNTIANDREYNFWALLINDIPTRISIMKTYYNESYVIRGIGALNYYHLGSDFPTLKDAKLALTDTFSNEKLFLVAYCARHENYFITDENNLPSEEGFICNECRRIKGSFYIYRFIKCKQTVKNNIITFYVDNEYNIRFLVKRIITSSNDFHKEIK